jgi:benzoyl-CoA reductase/2-hydroxyglutaryl-CoA dehydratase subunit BcrC/BadD/HgdB
VSELTERGFNDPGRAWFKLDANRKIPDKYNPTPEDEPVRTPSVNESVKELYEKMKKGKYDGVIGFSQGCIMFRVLIQVVT